MTISASEIRALFVMASVSGNLENNSSSLSKQCFEASDPPGAIMVGQIDTGLKERVGETCSLCDLRLGCSSTSMVKTVY